MAPVALAALLPGGAAAQATANEAALLERIRLLEQRLEQLERQSRPANARRAAPAPAVASRPDPVPPPSATAEPTRRDAAAPPAPGPAADRPLGAAAQASAAGRQGEQLEEIPQEAFIFRDQAVTLRPGKFEASLDLLYSRDRRALSGDRMLAGGVSVRAGLFDGVEAAVNLPFFHSTRTFEFGGGNVSDRELTNIGDASVQVNVRGWGERPWWPGIVFNAAVVAPTGPAPFIRPPTGITADVIPVDNSRLYSSRGTWALRGGVQGFKTIDPVVLFAGIGYEYAFETERQGVTYQPGQRITYNAGLSFAMSERSTLGLTFLGSYTTRLRADRVAFRPTATETAALRFALIQRVAESLWIEPSLTLGLVTESPSFQAGAGLRYRF